MFAGQFLGLLSSGFILLSFSYPILKRIKIKGKHLKFHCYFGYISIILGSIHAVINLEQINFSAGLICLLSMLLIMISGIIMKHFRKLFSINILVWKWMHIVLAAVCAVALIVHITEYLLFT